MLTSKFLCLIGGAIFGYMVGKVLGFDDGYEQGRRDERIENWKQYHEKERREKNE